MVKCLFISCIENKKAGKMFFDLTLAILALVVIFALGCIMLERRNNNPGQRASKRNPRRRKRVTRHHWEDNQYKTRREPEENNDKESYNRR